MNLVITNQSLLYQLIFIVTIISINRISYPVIPTTVPLLVVYGVQSFQPPSQLFTLPSGSILSSKNLDSTTFGSRMSWGSPSIIQTQRRRHSLFVSQQQQQRRRRRRRLLDTSIRGSEMTDPPQITTTDDDDRDDDSIVAPPNHVCIVGGGIIGTATAYFLATLYGIQSTIIDRSGTIAPAASGKAGGFLAYDWNDGTATEQLTHRSYQLHDELARKFQPESIQYRKLSCVSMNLVSTNKSKSKSKQPVLVSASTTPSSRKLQNIEWAATTTTTTTDGGGTSSVLIQNVRTLGTETTIAQVHPKLLCERLWYETQQCLPSCQLLQGNVIETMYDTTTTTTATNSRSVSGVRLDNGTIIHADAVLYACGPWNVLNSKTTGGNLQTCIRGDKYHSLIVPTKRIYTQCVFFHGLGDPEVYVRPDQTAYCTGFPEPPRIVTESPGEETIDSNTISTIYNAIRQVTATTTTGSEKLATNSTVNVENNTDGTNDTNHNDTPAFLLENIDDMIQQACYLPSTEDGIPIMGKLSHDHSTNNNNDDETVASSTITTNGRYIATGHSCWGILLGPGTGEYMATLIATGQSTTPYINRNSVDAFDPYRFL